MNVLVTGGAGYIGSHTCVELVNEGHEVTVLDDLRNSSQKAVERVEEITGKVLPLFVVDLCDKEAVKNVFAKTQFDAVIHFAGLKAVGESVEKPLEYYRINIGSTITLLEVMAQYNVNKIVFSSSATVYGDPDTVPITETAKLQTTNPYGETKLIIEQLLQSVAKCNPKLRVTILRYFNPIGAHKSGLIGEHPNGVPNNLVPYIAQVAIGKRESLSIYGDDYDTVDGSGVRDYIHVVDLAKGHLAALNNMNVSEVAVYNLGSGKGTSVLEMVKTFEKASGKTIPYQIKNRRPGDIATCYADPTKAKTELSWEATKSIQDMCADTWNWQVKNPNGYE